MIRNLIALCAVVVAFWLVVPAQAQVYQVFYPAPVTTYYAGPPTVYYPTAVPVTRYRPLLGGNITRWRYVYPATPYVAPTVTYYPAW